MIPGLGSLEDEEVVENPWVPVEEYSLLGRSQQKKTLIEQVFREFIITREAHLAELQFYLGRRNSLSPPHRMKIRSTFSYSFIHLVISL